MKKLFLTFLFIGLCAVAAFSQTTEERLQVAEQRLVKTLDSLEKAERLIAVLEQEIDARKRLESVNNEILEAKKRTIEEQKKLIAILEKQTGRKLSLFFGLLKVRF